jgi:hypothetical protein
MFGCVVYVMVPIEKRCNFNKEKPKILFYFTIEWN